MDSVFSPKEPLVAKICYVPSLCYIFQFFKRKGYLEDLELSSCEQIFLSECELKDDIPALVSSLLPW